MLRRIGLFSTRARSRASGDQGHQSTGLSACCSRYGLVSCARRLGIVRTLSARQLVQFVGQPTLELYRGAQSFLTHVRSPAGGQAGSASIAHRVVAGGRHAARDRTAAFAVSPIRDAATLTAVDEVRLELSSAYLLLSPI